MASSTKSENVLAEKFDVCVADTLIKMGGGLATGVVFSLFLFKRKSWPLAVGLGAGAGMGYANCQNRLNHPYLVKAESVKVKSNSVEVPATTQVSDPVAPSSQE